jgi:hypothetical protein
LKKKIEIKHQKLYISTATKAVAHLSLLRDVLNAVPAITPTAE